MDAVPTQVKIAEYLGMPRSTVAAALNPRLASRLRPHVQQRVHEAARQMGYVPHHAARRLASSRPDSRTTRFDQVGLVYVVAPQAPDAYVDPVCLAMMQGAEHQLAECDAALTFLRVRNDKDWQKLERLRRGGGVDGWLLYGAVNDAVVDRLKPTRLPFVVVGDHSCAQPVHSVNVDNAAVGRLAVQYLTSLGHQRIGFVGISTYFVYQQQTLAGFRAARRELGLDPDEQLILDGSLWKRDAAFLDGINEQLLLDWLGASEPPPTALFMPEAETAANLYRTLRAAKWEVPSQLNLLTCEMPSSLARSQNFTRLELRVAEVGQEGARLLHRIAAEPPGNVEEIKIPPLLIEGWSTSSLGN